MDLFYNRLVQILFAVFIGIILDMLIGDPHGFLHPVIIIGKCISFFEKLLRRGSQRKISLICRGAILVFFVILCSVIPVILILWAAYRVNVLFGITVEGVFCYFMFAARALQKESKRVYDALLGINVRNDAKAVIVGKPEDNRDGAEKAGKAADNRDGAENTGKAADNCDDAENTGKAADNSDNSANRSSEEGRLLNARHAVSMIVGRDTDSLTREGVIKATVETVAENTSDGVVAPIIYAAIFGAPLLYLYKAVNTMDSMIGYKNDKYLYFGRAAARLDDVLNFIPSRICAVAMILGAFILPGFSGRGAVKIFARDRMAHKSPNSAQTESAMAGALGVQLAGDASYFGVLHRKPFIGNPIRKIEAVDILKAHRLMFAAKLIVVVAVGFIYGVILW